MNLLEKTLLVEGTSSLFLSRCGKEELSPKDIHCWKIGIDHDNSGQSYRNYWEIDNDFYLVTMPSGINGEIMIRIKGYSKE